MFFMMLLWWFGIWISNTDNGKWYLVYLIQAFAFKKRVEVNQFNKFYKMLYVALYLPSIQSVPVNVIIWITSDSFQSIWDSIELTGQKGIRISSGLLELWMVDDRYTEYCLFYWFILLLGIHFNYYQLWNQFEMLTISINSKSINSIKKHIRPDKIWQKKVWLENLVYPIRLNYNNIILSAKFSYGAITIKYTCNNKITEFN